MSKERMPVIFIGHGSPMNALYDNEYTSDLQKLGRRAPRPEAVLVISAHWLTNGTLITSGRDPEQIYDFYGFPDELYAINYQPPGSPDIAAMISGSVRGVTILPDRERGIDHAAWAVLKHIYPEGDIPVLEMSLDMNNSPEKHYQTGKALSVLREKGLLIIGSGNIVHNLALMDFYENAEPKEWAVEFDQKVKRCLLENDHAGLIDYEKWGKISRYSVPTDEHYIPLLYVAALMQKEDKLEFTHEAVHHGTISMRCFIVE